MAESLPQGPWSMNRILSFPREAERAQTAWVWARPWKYFVGRSKWERALWCCRSQNFMAPFSGVVHFISDTHSNAICPDHIQGDDLTSLSFAGGDSVPLWSRAGCLATLTEWSVSLTILPHPLSSSRLLYHPLSCCGVHTTQNTGSLLQSGPIPSPPTVETIQGKITHFIPQLQGPVALPSLLWGNFSFFPSSENSEVAGLWEGLNDTLDTQPFAFAKGNFTKCKKLLSWKF